MDRNSGQTSPPRWPCPRLGQYLRNARRAASQMPLSDPMEHWVEIILLNLININIGTLLSKQHREEEAWPLCGAGRMPFLITHTYQKAWSCLCVAFTMGHVTPCVRLRRFLPPP